MRAASKRVSRRKIVRELAAKHGWNRIGETEWRVLIEAIPDLRSEHLSGAGMEVDAPWCGVRQHTFDELEQSLCDFSCFYENRDDLRNFCRSEVIRAKDKARIISRLDSSPPLTQQTKAQMVEWMLVWLSDPRLFPAWSDVRRTIKLQ
ncbi:MAG: hypothetical protein JWN34_4418 [Bryobacterales bacterium]|nr:hypothetical protein [Bryobacterales bacterium]